MADFLNFGITRSAPANVNVPTHNIAVTVVDTEADPDVVLADYTGENVLRWPSVLSTLTADQQDEIAADVASKIIGWKAGL